MSWRDLYIVLMKPPWSMRPAEIRDMIVSDLGLLMDSVEPVKSSGAGSIWARLDQLRREAVDKMVKRVGSIEALAQMSIDKAAQMFEEITESKAQTQEQKLVLRQMIMRKLNGSNVQAG